MLSPVMFAAAVLAGAPNFPPPASAPAGEESRQPAPEEGKGGPYEPVEGTTILVEGERAAALSPLMIAPDPAQSRRYAPQEREPLHRATIPF